eukprot:4339694-Ditylum_brightwellii.AAC.1
MEGGRPEFLVYSKKNQTIKYVNKESCHCHLVFKAMPSGKLAPKNIPTLKELYQQENDRRRQQKKKEEEAEKQQDGKPTKDRRIEDLTPALQDFARFCRWREFWHKREIERFNFLNPCDTKYKKPTRDLGLGTGLKLENYKRKGPQGSVELENFVYTLEAELLKK